MIAAPLNRLTQKGVDFDWSPACQNALEELRKTLSEAPVLAFPSEVGELVVDTDASDSGLCCPKDKKTALRGS